MIFFLFSFYEKYDISVNCGKLRKYDIYVECFYKNVLFHAVNIASKLTRLLKSHKEIQYTSIELNVSNKIFDLLSICRPPGQNIKFFLDKSPRKT